MARISIRSSAPRKPRSRFSREYGLLLDRLIAARITAGVSQQEVAGHLGKSQSHVSLIEARERELGIIDLYRWCRALGIGFSDFAQQFENDVRQLEQASPNERSGRRKRQLP